MMKQITFREADSDELETVLLYLKEAAIWLAEKGINYWQNWIDPLPNFINWIQRGFDENQFYIVKKGEVDIGCFRLQWQDPMFWGHQENNSGYIHSFTISRNLVGQGIGEYVLHLIESFCGKNQKKLLRLDCGTDIEGLRKYYEEYGFKAVDEITYAGEHLTLYEKHIVQDNGEQNS